MTFPKNCSEIESEHWELLVSETQNTVALQKPKKTRWKSA